MKKILTIVGLLSISITTLAADKPIRVNGIVCTAVKAINGVNPFLIIKDISETNATLILNMNDGLPDTRNSSLDKTVQNGKLLVGYVSHESAFSPSARRFAVYTNGSTPQNTTQANLTIENDDSEIKMTCKDGMAQ